MDENKEIKSLKDIKFDSLGDEYIYLYDFLEERKLLKESSNTIEELRKKYKKLSREDDNYDEQLKIRYDENVSNVYWTQKTEESIILFLATEDKATADKIFRTEIHGPLKKLIENIMFTYKLMRADISITESMVDCMSFLMTKLAKYDHKTGAKAYSYLGTIARHHLQAEKRNAYKATKTNLDIDYTIDEVNTISGMSYDMDELERDDENDTNSVVFEEIIKRLKQEISGDKMIDIDKKVSEAIVFILENHEMLNVYNKNLIYHLIKERTGLLTKDITYSFGRLKNYYKIFKQDFLKTLF